MWIGNRCSEWCDQPGCTITNIECGRRTNAIMLWKWASNYDWSCIRTNGMLMSIWFGATCIVRLLTHTSGWCQCLWCAVPINRSKSVSIHWRWQFSVLFTIGKRSSHSYLMPLKLCKCSRFVALLLIVIIPFYCLQLAIHSIRFTNWFFVVFSILFVQISSIRIHFDWNLINVAND